MQSLFGLDLTTAQKVIVASVVILVLLALLGLFVRQIQGGRLRLRGQASGRTRQPRLGVVDTHDLDRQRQLVLIRRDNVEHLVMIGGASDVVVETNIVRSGQRAAVPVPADLPMLDRPLPFESLVPAAEPARQEPVRQELRQEPVRHEPVDEPRKAVPAAPIAVTPVQAETLPPLPHRHAPSSDAAVAAAGVGAALGSALSGASAPPQSKPQPPAPNFTRDPAPAPAVSSGELDDMARQLEEALKRPFSAVRPANAPAAEPPRENAAARAPVPPPAEPKVEPAKGEAAKAEASKIEAPEIKAPEIKVAKPADPPAPTAPPPPPPTPFASPGQPARPAGDVEAELAMALGLKPEPSVPKAPETPKPQPAAPAEPVKAATDAPVSKAPAEPHDRDEAEEAEAGDVPERDDAAVEEPKVAGGPASKDEPSTAAEPKQKDEPAAIDPFSVDAIEAEFARLLGRDPKAKS